MKRRTFLAITGSVAAGAAVGFTFEKPPESTPKVEYNYGDVVELENGTWGYIVEWRIDPNTRKRIYTVRVYGEHATTHREITNPRVIGSAYIEPTAGRETRNG
jgi:hypothetical protein